MPLWSNVKALDLDSRDCAGSNQLGAQNAQVVQLAEASDSKSER